MSERASACIPNREALSPLLIVVGSLCLLRTPRLIARSFQGHRLGSGPLSLRQPGAELELFMDMQ
jgi:hypothetical protein